MQHVGRLLMGAASRAGDGSAGDSIYGGAFNDEKKGLALKHDQAGVLSMVSQAVHGPGLTAIAPHQAACSST